MLNMDYISQLISLSPTWQNLMGVGIAQIAGGGGGMGGVFSINGMYWNTLPFGEKDISKCTIVQKRLLVFSLQYQQYRNQYEVKTICKNCFDNDCHDIFLHRRQRKCNVCEKDVRRGQNRYARYYYTQDQNHKLYISEKDFTILTLVDIMTEKFKKRVETERRLKSKNKKGRK